MSRVVVLFVFLVSATAIAMANSAFQHATGTSPLINFHWLIVPIGAIILGVLMGLMGLFSLRMFNIVPSVFDALSIALGSLLLLFLNYYLSYASLRIDGRNVSEFISFSVFLKAVLTNARFNLDIAGGIDLGRVGAFGYGLAALKLIGIFAGGLAYFGGRNMQRCTSCNRYFKRIGRTDSGTVTAEEAIALTHMIKNGNYLELQSALSWKAPQGRLLHKGQPRYKLDYFLLGCPQCGAEAITECVSEWTGRYWQPTYTGARSLGRSQSLRGALTAPKNSSPRIFSASPVSLRR